MAQAIPQLPETGYVRLPQIIGDKNAEPPIPAIIPVSKSTWWEGVRTGALPGTSPEHSDDALPPGAWRTSEP